jgi:polyisoprenoid-binding protein YceI
MADLPLSSGTWVADTHHSAITFKVRHLGLTNVHGRFNSFTATLVVGESLADTQLSATIDIASVDTNDPDRDAHLRSGDFFAAESHPTMTFVANAISGSGADYTAEGDLTINGITKPVALAVEFAGSEVHPGDGKVHAGFEATTVVNRDDFGIDFNMPLGMDKVAVGKKLTVAIDIQFTPAP